MKKSYLFLFIFIYFLFSLQEFFTTIAFSATTIPVSCVLQTTLRIGSTGEEVRCLQSMLGTVVDGRFGPKTKMAVVSWQLSHNLKDDGIVGPLTRGALALINTATVNLPEGCVSILGYSSTTGIKCDSKTNLTVEDSSSKTAVSSSNNNLNPNEAELEEFINLAVGFAREKGYNEEKLELIASVLREDIIKNGTRYREEFKSMLAQEASVGLNGQSSFNEVFAKALSFLGITPLVAEANNSNSVPFGGKVGTITFCPVSGNWLIHISPLPPSFSTLLSYFEGTQGFASYNTPFTSWLLGTYKPPGVCSYGVVDIPTYGVITPVVGSSLL